MVNRHFVIGFIACLVLMGCSGFSYHYYGLDQVDYQQGFMRGPKPKDDLPFSVCAPDASNKFKCVVLLAKDFFAFKQDYEDVKLQLQECQKKN